jgi:heat shock protein HslJ
MPTSLPSLLRLAALAAALMGVVFLNGCKSPRYPTSTVWPLNGTVWKLTELNGGVVAANHLPSLVFDSAAHQVSGQAGVNTFSGGYTQQDAALDFSPFAVTRMAGKPSQMKLEGEFLKALDRVTAWKIEGAILTFYAGETEIARFQGLPAGAPQ